MASALPLVRTRISGLPAAARASTSSCSGLGKSIVVRSPPLKPGSSTGISSPSSSLVMPTTATTTSAFFAASTAWASRWVPA